MTFLDHIREEPETWITEVFGGFDPDLHTAGLAHVKMRISSHGRRSMDGIDVRTLRRNGRKGIDAANNMLEVIHQHRGFFYANHAIVEGQQAYPPSGSEKDTIARSVAIANDLLMLGLISGAAASTFQAAGAADAKVLLPSQWKGQRQKKAMHDAALRTCLILPAGALTVDGFSVTQEKFHPCEHVKDALCMALRAAGYSV